MSSNPEHGDIYWADLRPAKGSEQDGFRPVFIVSNKVMNEVSPVIIAVPMTRAEREIQPFQFRYDVNDLDLIEKNVQALEREGHRFDTSVNQAFILTQQARAISKERLVKKLGRFKTDEYVIQIKEAFRFLYALDGCINCHYPLRKDALKCRNCGTKHLKKCQKCKHVHNYTDKYCPNCGEEASRSWLK